MLPLMEAFYTLQGEGYHVGKAAYFVRLGGCDVGCHWCDVKESWEAEKHPQTSIESIVANTKAQSNTVVITGGEPLVWNLELLTNKLRDSGVQIHLETSGAYPLTGVWDWICLSPKKTKLPVASIYAKANELKMIIYNKSDFKFAESEAQKVNPTCKLYLQVEWSKRKELTPLIVDYVKNNPKWKITLQTHKYLDIP